MAVAALHRLWRGLPQGPRRRLLATGTGWLAPRPSRPAPACRVGAAVVGEVSRASGLGESARLHLAALGVLGVPHWGADDGVPPAGVPLILHTNAAIPALEMLRLGRHLVQGRRIVGVWPWELQAVPASWRAGFEYVHEVWAPSRFSADAIRAAAPPGWDPGCIRVVPHPVACRPPEPASLGRADFGLPDDAVVTLAVVNLASAFTRKNPLGAIEAHRRAFGTRSDRVLLLRVGNPGHAPGDFALLREAAAGLANVVLDTETRPRDEAWAAMAAADIVLSLHRSEGFGLVPAEAMLLGKAVVLTGWSGTEEFATDASTVRVPYTLVPAVDPRGVFTAPGALWAEPDLDAAAGALAELADDPARRVRLGGAARAAAAGLDAAPLARALRGLGLDVAG